MSGAVHLRASPGPSFARITHPRRPKIAGSSGGEGFGAALEHGTHVLSPKTPIVFDTDTCSFEDQWLTTAADWAKVIAKDAFARVEGAFAVAWRTAEGAIHLARDPIGHRSLYYAISNGDLVFASSLRALLDAARCERRLRLRSLAAYLAYAYVPGRETMVEGVFEVLPGERVSFVRGRLERALFWDLPAEPSAFRSEDELLHALRAELEQTISRMLPAGSNVAASLSGGIDSSLVVALAQRLHDRTIGTFSITFGSAYKDELPFSSLVADHAHTAHTIVEITPEAIVAHLDDTIACLDKPNGDPLTVPNALLFRTMAEHAAVVLNGEGGDPCFGGPKNIPMVLSELYGDALDGGRPLSRERNYLRAHLKCFDELGDLLEPGTMAEACTPPLENDLAPWFEDPRWNALVARLMAINVRFKGGHHILPKVDALSAPFGVFARSPLFAKAIVELAFAIPAHLKLRGSVEKYLLKEAVRHVLPDAIVDRPKSGMMVPVEGWFQGPLLPEARARILDGLSRHALFRRPYLENLLGGKIGGLRPRHGVKIWLLITLESHLRALGF